MVKLLSSIAGILFMFGSTCWASHQYYLGVSVGPEYAQFRQKAHIVSPGRSDIIDKTRFAGKGVFGSIFVGVQKYFSLDTCREDFFLACEFNFDISSVTFKSSNDEFVHQTFNKAKYAAKHSVGLSLLPGLLLNNSTLFYARLGGLSRNFKIITTENTLPNTNKNRYGFRYGLGIQQCLSDQFAFRLEYSQALYQKMRIFGNDAAGGVTKNTSIAPQTQKFEIGLIYNFN